MLPSSEIAQFQTRSPGFINGQTPEALSSESDDVVLSSAMRQRLEGHKAKTNHLRRLQPMHQRAKVLQGSEQKHGGAGRG